MLDTVLFPELYTQDTGYVGKILSDYCVDAKLLEGIRRNLSTEPHLKYLLNFAV